MHRAPFCAVGSPLTSGVPSVQGLPMVLTIRKRGSWGLAVLGLVLRTPGLHLVAPNDTTLAEVRNECSFANGAELTEPALGEVL